MKQGQPIFVEKAVVAGESECPFCKGRRKAEIRVEIASRKTGEVVGVARMCRDCHKRKQNDRWFEWNEVNESFFGEPPVEEAG